MLADQKDAPVPHNDDVVKFFEEWLEEAKLGRLSFAAVAVCKYPNLIAADFVGTDMGMTAEAAVDRLRGLLAATRLRRTASERNEALGLDHCCYNLAKYPVSFDFLPWIVTQTLNMRRAGLPGPLKVGFALGEDGRTGLSDDYSRMMFPGVVRPLVGLFGAVEDAAACGGNSPEFFGLRDVVAAARAGEQLPSVVPGAEARRIVDDALSGAPAPVVITLREATHWRFRNSNLSSWTRLARELERDGENVIFVRDTAMATKDLPGFATYPLAAVNLPVRAALYERAKINLFVSNGPATIAMFNDRPWLHFIPPEPPDSECVPNTRRGFREVHGIEVGEQFPWQRPGQRIVWTADDYEHLRAAWEEFKSVGA
jgi:hypothetical protein